MFLGPVPADCPTKINCELSNLNLTKLNKNLPSDIGSCFFGEVFVDPVILVIDSLDIRQLTQVINQVVLRTKRIK